MRLVKLVVVGLSAAVGLGMSACTGATESPAPAPGVTTHTPSPSETLTMALASVKGLNCDLTVTQPGQDAMATGSVNYGTESATVTSKAPAGDALLSITATQVGPKLWVKMDLGSSNSRLGLSPNRWYLVDQTKLTGANAKPFDLANSDALDIAGLMVSTSRVARKDSTHITGTVDLTRSTGVSAPAAADLTKAGTGATAVPFTATVDDQGRLVDLLIQADTVDPDLTYEYAFSNFGAPSAIAAPPPAEVTNAPNSVYTILNSL